MNLEIWIAFCVATIILTAIPGPIVLYLLAHTLTRNLRETLLALVGVILGDSVLIALAFLGVGTVLLASAWAFSILKWIGALYLIYLGVSQLLPNKKGDPELEVSAHHQPDRSFRNGFFVALLNPKTIVFFLSFFPQFITQNEPMTFQFIVLFASFLFMVTLTLAFYIAIASSARGLFVSGRLNGAFQLLSGWTMIGAGLWTGLARRGDVSDT